MNRRTALRWGGLALTGSLSGCSSVVSSEPATITISEIQIRNRLDEEKDVSILLLNGDVVEYWQTVTVPVTPTPFTTVVDLPEGPGEYVLYGQITAVERDTPVRADLVEDAGDRSCIRVYMEVSMSKTDSDEYPGLAYGAIEECRESR